MKKRRVGKVKFSARKAAKPQNRGGGTNLVKKLHFLLQNLTNYFIKESAYKVVVRKFFRIIHENRRLGGNNFGRS